MLEKRTNYFYPSSLVKIDETFRHNRSSLFFYLIRKTWIHPSKYEKKNYRKEKRERERKKRTQHGSEQCLKSGQN